MGSAGEPILDEYREEDRLGFARLVDEVHAEFGFPYDPALDTDLANPAVWYSRL